MQLIPLTAKRAQGVRFEIRLNRTATTATELIDVDIKVSPF